MPATTTRTRPPRRRAGQVTEVDIGGMDIHITITELADGRPGEVFLRAGKQGSTIAGLCEALSLTTSLALQHGTPVQDVVTRLQAMRYEPAGLTNDPDIPQTCSISDYLARRLHALYLTPEEPIVQALPTPQTRRLLTIADDAQNPVFA